MVSRSNTEVREWWEVYDDHRTRVMGWDLGYMGHFQSYEDVVEYLKEYSYLFEGKPQVFHRSSDKS